MAAIPYEDNIAKPLWLPRHQEKLAEVAKRGDEIRLVFIGDSIIHAWEDFGESAWHAHFAMYGALNLGFGGDRTEHALWRVANGELDGLNSQVVVLMIGTNNTGHRKDPADYTARAITLLVDEIHQRLPNAHILLHAIFPRGKTASDPLRSLNNEINRQIQHLEQRVYVTWLDFTHLFLQSDGSLSREIMDDYLHPNANQYPRWAAALQPHIKQYLKK
ncbi:GDSL-type esterase/lipase family protein [Alteromonas sp. ASW11-36]|uniref:GDSL-type esterase/lipase family protein n=1 Tax=Alteromonas arenosi TaxID=3055817 RepID=A0ABT7SZD4_9ALTE|nr:GDSL-type esterase/lipase family protein [Alteromonas sp. ASW11-36]MDM7861525.1 GDSL-type esterase/lipase family protein [Alteromonas sp. ASW11-36]